MRACLTSQAKIEDGEQEEEDVDEDLAELDALPQAAAKTKSKKRAATGSAKKKVAKK